MPSQVSPLEVEPPHPLWQHNRDSQNMLETSSEASTLSETASSSSSEEDTTVSNSLLGKFDWDEIPFDILRSRIEPIRRRPVWPERTAEEYNDEVLQRRRFFLRQISVGNPYRLPCVLRYTACYEHFLGKAQSDSLRQTQMPNGDSERIEETPKLHSHALRQIMLFDRVQDLSHHPCEFPPTQLGNVYLSSAVILLKYTMYTRYRYYVGRCLDSLDFPVRPVFKRMWKRAHTELAEESDWLAGKKRNRDSVQESEYSNIVVHSIMYRINQQLRVRALTMERAIQSLEKYARHRHRSGCWDGTAETEVRTFELENMVRKGDYQAFAETLCSDFVALDSLKRFEQDDLELVHLQAIVCGLAEVFFGLKHIRRSQDEDVGRWILRPMFWHERNRFRRDNAERFSEALQWSLRVRAEKAEERFGNAWTALHDGQGEEKELVHELLEGYLESLGVEYAVPIDEEERFVADKLCNGSTNDSP